jgi:hypothetical protein
MSAVAVAARPYITPQTGTQAAPPAQPPVQPPADTSTAAPVMAPATLGVQPDSTSAQGAASMADSAQPSMTQMDAPQPSVAAYPVDAQGRTLINGIPVVGRVFVMQKVDGLRKYEGVARHYVNEPLPPEAPRIGTGYVQAPPQAARRHRGSMVQATLWGIETKPSAIETHHYRPTTTTGALQGR